MKSKFATLTLATALAGCASAATVPRQWNSELERPAANAAELVEHHPAVRVSGTASGMKLFIRASQSEPLVILDGISLGPEWRGALSMINPRDVGSIKVLTDPADLTLYGGRGANGVIVVTTKRP